MPAVINLAVYRAIEDGQPATLDGVVFTEAMRQLEAAGADVVGLNCARGPATMLPLLEKLKETIQVSKMFLRFIDFMCISKGNIIEEGYSSGHFCRQMW